MIFHFNSLLWHVRHATFQSTNFGATKINFIEESSMRVFELKKCISLARRNQTWPSQRYEFLASSFIIYSSIVSIVSIVNIVGWYWSCTFGTISWFDRNMHKYLSRRCLTNTSMILIRVRKWTSVCTHFTVPMWILAWCRWEWNTAMETGELSENRFIHAINGGDLWKPYAAHKHKFVKTRKETTPFIFRQRKINVAHWDVNFCFRFPFYFRHCVARCDLYRSLSHDTDHRENFIFDINAWVYWTVNGQLIEYAPNNVVPYVTN